MRNFLKIFAEEWLYPKTIFVTSFLMIFLGTPYFVISNNISYYKVSASMAGILGTLLAARSIIRKGFSKIVEESRQTDLGDFGGIRSTEDWNVEWDAEAQAMGSVSILCSAFIIFLVEIFKF